MYIRAREYKNDRVEEYIATFEGLEYDYEDGLMSLYCTGFLELLIRVSENQYLEILNDISNSLSVGNSIFDLTRFIGIAEDYEYDENSWEKHLENLNYKFNIIDNLRYY